MNVTLWDTSSDVRKELSIQDDRTESDNRIEVTLLIGIAENNLPHIARWESTKPPYAEPHVRWCGRSVNVKIGGKCLLWLAFTSYPILKLLAFKVSWILYKSYQQFPWTLPLWVWDAPCGSLHQLRCSLGWGGYGHEEPPDPKQPAPLSCMGRLPW